MTASGARGAGEKYARGTRSYTMSRIRGKDTSIEVMVRSYLFRRGLRFRKNDKRYPGHPDVVLPKYHAIVFVNGCFWHMHEHGGKRSMPKSNVEFWSAKLLRNRERDRVQHAELERAGWRVIDVWECELTKKARAGRLERLYRQIVDDDRLDADNGTEDNSQGNGEQDMSDAIKVSVVGAKGRMGSHVVDAVNGAADTQLALALDAGDDLTRITADNTDVVVEFTVPSVSLDNVLALIAQGVDVVVGTTGWTDEKLDRVREAIANGPAPATQKVFIAPNFAISAVLADYFSTQAAKYFESVEVIELHHPNKVDAPSGTAIHTAAGIARARKEAGLGPVPDNTQTDGGSRGQVVDGVHVHAVRLRGLNAHEEVLFGNAGEQLTIRADSFDRGSFMPGVLLAVRKLASDAPAGLTVGLDKFLDL